MRFHRMQFESVVGLVIWQEGDRSGGRIQAISYANARMVHKFGANMHLTQIEIHRVELLEIEPSRQIVQCDRKKRRRHLALENFAQARVGPIAAKDVYV